MKIAGLRIEESLLSDARGHRHPTRSLAKKTISRSLGFRPGIDLDKLGQLADGLEAEALVGCLSLGHQRHWRSYLSRDVLHFAMPPPPTPSGIGVRTTAVRRIKRPPARGDVSATCDSGY
jgi:hypothetical protein